MNPIEALKKNAGVSNEVKNITTSEGSDYSRLIRLHKQFKQLESTGLLFHLKVYNKMAECMRSCRDIQNPLSELDINNTYNGIEDRDFTIDGADPRLPYLNRVIIIGMLISDIDECRSEGLLNNEDLKTAFTTKVKSHFKYSGAYFYYKTLSDRLARLFNVDLSNYEGSSLVFLEYLLRSRFFVHTPNLLNIMRIIYASDTAVELVNLESKVVILFGIDKILERFRFVNVGSTLLVYRNQNLSPENYEKEFSALLLEFYKETEGWYRRYKDLYTSIVSYTVLDKDDTLFDARDEFYRFLSLDVESVLRDLGSVDYVDSDVALELNSYEGSTDTLSVLYTMINHIIRMEAGEDSLDSTKPMRLTKFLLHLVDKNSIIEIVQKLEDIMGPYFKPQ